MKYDMDQKLAELRVNGYVMFEDLLPVEKVDRMRDAFMVLLEQVKERETEIRDWEEGDLRTGKGRLQRAHRYCMYWPLDPPFLDAEVYANPVVLELLDRYWATDDFFLTCLHSNNPYPGAVWQNWHRDTALLTPGIGNPRHPTLAAKIPLVDTNEQNGSFQVLPGTQYLAVPEYEGKYKDILTQEGFDVNPRRLNMKKGTVWMQDPRTIHRGTPNTADHPRPELCVCYCLPWLKLRSPVEIHKECFEQLTERGKQLFKHAVLLD
jgi:ectoine hydroxylase-related dioxygenase (phytanoyl-CoA dioxygenase family)